MWELAAAGTPAVLVPYPHATADHQTLNARHFERGGGAIVVPDAERRPRPGARRRAARRPGSARARCATAMLALARPDAADVIAEELIALARSADERVATTRSQGRRLYFVGIGGSGMSAYANVARAWGAEVRGWDARETIFMRDARRHRRRPRRRAAARRTGWRWSSRPAHRDRIDGTPRAEFLAELVAAQPSIVVAGAHGKTTTAAMIAFALRETGHDPAWIVGGVVPQLGGNAGVGAGLARRRGRRVRPLGLRAPAADRGRHERRARPSRGLRLGRPSCARRSTRGSREVPDVVRGWELEPVDARARRPRASTTAGMPPRRSRRSSASASTATPRKPRSRRSTGVGRRFELVGERGGVTVYDDYAPQPDRARGPRSRRRASARTGGSSPSTSRTSSSARATSTASSATRSGSPTSPS